MKDASNKRWNTQLLKDEGCFTAFQLKLRSELSKMNKNLPTERSIENKWTHLTSCLKGSARNTLTSRRLPLTPTRKKALTRFHKAKFATYKDRSDPNARREYEEALKERKEEFFDNLNEHDPQVRIRLTFKF